MEQHQSPDAVGVLDNNSEEIPDHFICCVCLDLLYKPIVLHCGHIACFWCVHNSMNSQNESHCPVCRNPYSHFPGICETLHFLLLKLYPIAYKKREVQTLVERTYFMKLSLFRYTNSGPDFAFEAFCLCFSDFSVVKLNILLPLYAAEEEKRAGYFSLEFNDHTCESHADTGMRPVAGQEKDWISVADLLCTACKQLIFRPIVLNCGHVYCQTCIIFPANEMLRCPVCQCLHPSSFPNICLTLDRFLAARFPNEYALRKDSVLLKQVSSKHRATTCMSKCIVDPILFYKMSPILGDRYKCIDCTEKIGYDLCGDCYTTRPKLPGRFNQRHTPEHRFERLQSYESNALPSC
ncbi:hypothetical protein GQ457_02G004390 [Hibiscus cannabinus]